MALPNNRFAQVAIWPYVWRHPRPDGRLGGLGFAMVAVNPYAGMVSALDDREFDLLRSAVAERHCRELIGAGTLSEAADLWRPHPQCPSCGFPDSAHNGRTPAGRQRWLCPACGESFSALAGTVLEHVNKELPAWERFITCMCYNAPIDLAAEICEIAHTTAFEWRHRVFATVDGYQDRLVLRGRVWIDELYLTDSDIVRGADFVQRRGLSRNKICVAVAIDAFKNAVVVICGHGKPSSGRIKGALLSHIAPGSTIVHDKERSHPSLVKAAGCADEAYKADPADPAYLEAMALVNNLCSWLRRYLFRFPGMKQANLQSYLNWFVYLFRVKRDEGDWPKTARVLRHLLMSDAHYRSSR